jgi:hypothetical protein
MRTFVVGLALAIVTASAPAVAAPAAAQPRPDLCAALATVAGAYGPYAISDAGSLSVAGEVVRDCSPGVSKVAWYDSLICPILAALAGYLVGKGIVDITTAGDLYIMGAMYWDCPPYES